MEETKPQLKSSKDLEGESSYIEIPSLSQVAEEIDDENLPPAPSTHGTFDEEEDEARRNESAEFVVGDDTVDFLCDSYSGTEEVPDDGKEDREGEGEDYEEGE